jgi:tetratricopeptide (TPR) repeat protein
VKIHPGEEMLVSLLRSLDAADPRIFQHLTGCSRCRSRLVHLPRRREYPAHDPAPVALFRPAKFQSYDTAFERSGSFVTQWARLLGREREEAPGLFAELMERTGEQREILLRNSRRFRTWGLLELAVERSLQTSIQDSDCGEELGRLALRIADFLDADRYGADQLEDLRARAWAYVGNARRIRSDLQGSEEAFRQSLAHLQQGTGDLFEQAVLLDLKASLRRSQRLFDASLKLLRKAIAIFLEIGDLHRAGRSLVNLSTVLLYAGRAEESIPVLHRAQELMEPEREPRLLLIAKHNLAFVLTDLSRFLEAQRAYSEARPLYRSFPDAWTQNRRRWVKGRIARGLGQREQAEALFLAARDGFLAEGIPYDTALVSLEIALLYAEQGRTAELKRLAAGMVPIFASRQIHREALAALAFFRQAAESERAGVEVVEKVAAYLRKARYAPDLRFQKLLFPEP